MAISGYGLAFLCGCVLVAGVIRGYSGFGFSMVAMVSLSLLLPPVEVVPVILLLEVAASGWLLPQIWRQIHWESLSWLALGVLLGTPMGVYLLTLIPAQPMRTGISLVVIVLAVLLWRGFHLKEIPGKNKSIVVGVISGVLNGVATIGGPPVILFYFSGPAGVTVSRASLIAFFLGTDVLALCVSMLHGLVTLKTGTLTAIFLVPLLLGVSLGSRFFNKSDAQHIQRKVLILLMLLSITALIRSFWE